MKKAIFSVTERRERITIRHKKTGGNRPTICEKCGEQFEWLTVEEAKRLYGNDAKDIRRDLETLRRREK